ncbi:PREDICTED: BAG family molecular chaperone regulator 7-like [Nelumbo nucifera]|uniref:BAG family molecular chaperone regulator 7-like n=2 Tax=Nelumbo nucifera TaxID=4432 RepID=A0A822ZYC2_NELNU|nr:PREDICTED: BAG family molecular chaperone regulator 7-like [Nelumbo nucifera]DAD47836.1 TPA_asm: hypothetical protein HUJ06_017773 [Nelumbo nucifera]
MSAFRRIEIFEPSPSLLIRETSICRPKSLIFPPFAEEEEDEFALTLHLLNPKPSLFDLSPQCYFPAPAISSPFDVLDTVTDLIQIEKTPFSSSYKRYQERIATDSCLRSLCDRVSSLELGFDRLLNAKKINKLDRKYSWTAKIKDPEEDCLDRKYKWTAEIKGAKSKDGELGGVEKNYEWTVEMKGKGKHSPISQTYTLKASTSPAAAGEGSSNSSKPKKKGVKSSPSKRVVEIEGPVDHGAVILKQAFAKRAGSVNNGKGKKKELSPQDAAMVIQTSFRAYLIRRSQALRALRELAVAKSKLKEMRAYFNNLSYRRRVTRDAEERQRFSEKIIVLILTVDAIEGVDVMVRTARKSMIDELEAMFDVVDPQPAAGIGKLGSMKRRKFDLPEGGIQKEIAAGVAEVVQMLDQVDSGKAAFEACL